MVARAMYIHALGSLICCLLLQFKGLKLSLIYSCSVVASSINLLSGRLKTLTIHYNKKADPEFNQLIRLQPINIIDGHVLSLNLGVYGHIHSIHMEKAYLRPYDGYKRVYRSVEPVRNSVMDSSRNDTPYRKKEEHFWALAGGALIIIIGLIIIICFAFLRPYKPQFNIQDTTVHGLNISNPNLLTCNMQVTLSTRNPKHCLGVYSEKLDVHAIYRNQQITLGTLLPSAYLDHKEISVWSPFLYGKDVPISPLLAAGLMADLKSGCVPLVIEINGRLKWKIGSSMMPGIYQLIVKCPAYVPLGSPSKVDSAVKYEFVQFCKVIVI